MGDVCTGVQLCAEQASYIGLVIGDSGGANWSNGVGGIWNDLLVVDGGRVNGTEKDNDDCSVSLVNDIEVLCNLVLSHYLLTEFT